jgi:hypothetical protein
VTLDLDNLKAGYVIDYKGGGHDFVLNVKNNGRWGYNVDTVNCKGLTYHRDGTGWARSDDDPANIVSFRESDRYEFNPESVRDAIAKSPYASYTNHLKDNDAVNHPKHYTSHPSGIECIQITEHMGFNLGNAVKYIWRADLKNDAIEDLKKAVWYINREIAKREKQK